MAPQAKSTLAIYQCRWSIYVKWCDEWDILPFEATIPELAEFFLNGFHTKDWTLSTILGYWSAIAGAFKAVGRTGLGTDQDLTDLLSNLKQERHMTVNRVPQWDLEFVPLPVACLSPCSRPLYHTSPGRQCSCYYLPQGKEDLSFMQCPGTLLNIQNTGQGLHFTPSQRFFLKLRYPRLRSRNLR